MIAPLSQYVETLYRFLPAYDVEAWMKNDDDEYTAYDVNYIQFVK